MSWLGKMDWLILITIAIILGLAPFQPEPHLVEKLRMLTHGSLTKPVDIFDLLMHSAPLFLIIIKAVR